MLTFDTVEEERWVLSEEGTMIADHGSHEVKVFEAVPTGSEGIALAELQVGLCVCVGEAYRTCNDYTCFSTALVAHIATRDMIHPGT